MHLIATIPGGWNPNDDGVFYIEQEPGDIVFLSAADTELYAVNKAYGKWHGQDSTIPSLRMANLTYFKQELTIDTYVDEVISKADLVVLKLLGGVSYFSYLCEAIAECAEENDIKVVFLPGDAKPDLELMQMSTVDLQSVDYLWKLLIAGGTQNTDDFLGAIVNLQQGKSFEKNVPEALPETFFMNRSKEWGTKVNHSNTPWCLILSYRSYYLSDNLAAIEALMEELEESGIPSSVFFAQGYRDPQLETAMVQGFSENPPSVIINTTGFSIQKFEDAEKGLFDRLNVPVLQAIVASCNQDTWASGMFGLTPIDIAMQVTLPEVDGKVITSVISFKESGGKDTLTDSEIVAYIPHAEGIIDVVAQTKAWIRLQNLSNEEKKIALVLPNYPNKNSRLANGVGLDTPQSTVNIIRALAKSGYQLNRRVPESSEELIELLTSNVTNDIDTLEFKEAEVKLNADVYQEQYNTLAPELRSKIEEQWGVPEKSPNYKDGCFLIPGVELGSVFLSIQPSRGYNLDLEASYHSPDLPPTHAYLAYYIWLHHTFKADAVVHVGKHGNLEWLPGKSIALSKESCFPAAILKPIPHFYPFIVNDPGEGTQAKRRTHAVVVDHLIPPMTRAENHGDLLKLELLIDEFYEAALLDPKRSQLLKSRIEELITNSHLRTDLQTDATEIDELMEAIDGYLCELKEAQIRGGLHILGEVNQEKKRDLIIALHRLPQGDLKGITQAIAWDEKLDFDPIDCTYEESCSIQLDGMACRSLGQVVEVLEIKAQRHIESLLEGKEATNVGEETAKVLRYISKTTLDLIAATTNEIENLIAGLNGAYVPSGGSGAPTRGRLDILPTGRNFYSVDVRTIPSESAFQLGEKSARNIIDRYLQENGEYPTSIGISVWGTATMRTSGDDIAQGLALMGVRPVWQGVNRRVKDFEVLSLLDLKRPRIDVTLRISGFFRDAFPDVIALFNAAVEKVAAMDEPLDQNPIRKRYLEERSNWEEEGLTEEQAHERSLYRVFGSKPGAYGAGLQGLIDEKNWDTQEDLARAYINWSGYAYYGAQNTGRSAHEAFTRRLANMEIVMQNQDNREHDLLDSDDYYQFQGGLNAAVTMHRGEQPTTYFGDHSRPENPRVKSLQEELLKVYRSRVINPKWMKGMRDHGYKGAFEMAATMDYLFAYDATTNLIEDFMYEGITNAYLLDDENQAFIEKNNPWALKDMSERMLEAIQRGLWKEPSEEQYEAIKSLYLKMDNHLEE